MNRFLRLACSFLIVLLIPGRVDALTLPASEDTAANTTGYLTRNAGKVSTLSIAPNRAAFVRFDVAAYAESVNADDVIRARLTFYIARARTAGALAIHAVTSDWAETVETKVFAPPIVQSALANVPQDLVRANQFVSADVTQQVKQWLSAPEGDFGFAIVGVGQTAVVLASKEGPGIGPAATLEIDTTVVQTIGDAQLAFGIDATKLGDGSVSNAEFQRLSGTTANVQGQLDALALELGTAETQITALEQTDTELTLDLGTKVSKSGGTLTGALHLPPDGLTVGTDALAVSNGRVGLGTASPQADVKLEVRGNVRLGATGNLFAPGSGENLRIVRGTVRFANGALSIISGGGFTAGPVGGFNYPITFTQAFSAPPTITITLEIGSSLTTVALSNVSSTGATIISGAFQNPTTMHIIAIGPR